MDLSYRIEGALASGEVLGVGKGMINPLTGESEVEVDFERRPSGWDPRTIVLMCCSRSIVMSSQESGGACNLFSASGGILSIGRHLMNANRRGTIRDASGSIVADVQASSMTDLRGNKRYDFSRIEGGFSKIEPGVNGVVKISPFDGLMMQAGPNVVTIVTSYVVDTEDGKQLFGYTFYPHYLPEQKRLLAQPQTLKVLTVDQELNGDHLYLRTTSVVVPLAEVATKLQSVAA